MEVLIMVKFALICAAIATIPCAAIARNQTATAKTTPAIYATQPSVDTTKSTPASNTGSFKHATWFVGNDGLLYSNICQTPDFWVAFARYYLVGSGCVARLNGLVEEGVMVQR